MRTSFTAIHTTILRAAVKIRGGELDATNGELAIVLANNGIHCQQIAQQLELPALD